MQDMKSRAFQDHEKYRGKLLKVTGAQIGIGDGDGLGWVEFDPDKPLLVRIDDRKLTAHDINPSRSGSEDLIDTYYDATALPGQLADGEYVSWIYGPTYHSDGTVEKYGWVGEPFRDPSKTLLGRVKSFIGISS